MLWYTTPLWSMETIAESGGDPAAAGDLSPRLLLINGREPGKSIVIPLGRQVIGRDQDCDILLTDDSVSRQHAILMREIDGSVTIENLSATNGTQVNSNRISSVKLKNGDIVQFGSLVLKYLEPGTMEAELFEHVYRLAIYDTLTQTLTKSAILHHFETMVESETEPFAVILMDLDHFKSINDSFGHLAGDFVLRKVAQIARSTAKRPGDLIGRFGGEEFLILLPKTGEEQAAAIAETIRANIEAERILVEGLAEPVRVTASFGIAIWNGPHAVNGHSRLNMIDKADKALYRAKNAGRNTVRFADQSVSN